MKPARVLPAAGGGVLVACQGCGGYPCSSLWLAECDRCGLNICRVCADRPNAPPRPEKGQPLLCFRCGNRPNPSEGAA